MMFKYVLKYIKLSDMGEQTGLLVYWFSQHSRMITSSLKASEFVFNDSKKNNKKKLVVCTFIVSVTSKQTIACIISSNSRKKMKTMPKDIIEMLE